jgi:glutamate synthase domain-containing protein 1
MYKIESLLNGKDVKNLPAIGKLECDCGIWFYANKDFMINILGAQLFEKLDSLHERWHIEYAKIYEIFFNKEKKKGLLSKLLGINKIDPLQLDKAKLYYVELTQTTEELLKVSDTAERRVSALNESKFL